MAEHDEGFDPAMGEEDVEQRFSQLSAEDAQLVRELREQYSLRRAQSKRVLAHAWERIQQEQPANERLPRDTRIDALVPTLSAFERKKRMKDINSAVKKPNRLKRTLNVLAAVIVLAVLLGSMGLVYSHLHAQSGTGSGPQGAQASVTALPTQQTGATPTMQPTTGGTTPTTQPTAGITPTVQLSPTLLPTGSLNWPVGQSTYWANLRYHQLTNYWVAWHGNANQWVDGARGVGWDVSQTPHSPSIMVLMSYVQGAGFYGHVAVVESINGNTVHTSNMDWSANGGGLNKVSYADFTVGSGVYFIWHP